MNSTPQLCVSSLKGLLNFEVVRKSLTFTLQSNGIFIFSLLFKKKKKTAVSLSSGPPFLYDEAYLCSF